MKHALLAAAVVALVVSAVACDRDGGTGTPSPTPNPSVVVLPQETSTPTPSATPAVEIQHTVWLLNLWEGERYTIYEHPELPGLASWAAPHIARVDGGSGPGFYGRAGNAISYPLTRCREGEAGVEVGGVVRPEIHRCGPISPNGRYMLFETSQDPAAYPPITQQWQLEIERDEVRLLQDGVQGCGGCDGRFGPQWTPDGRYVLFAETAQDGRVFLADLEAGTSEVVSHGTEIQFRPSWSSDAGEPRFLVADEDGAAVLVNAETHARTPLPVDWPARFDATGTLAYSPTADPRQGERGVTSVVDIETLELTEVAGVAPWNHLWEDGTVVSARDRGGGFTAALIDGDCAGTVVHSTGFPSRCVEGAYGATPSWNGQQVAFAMLVPGEDVFNGTRFSRYDIAVLDIETGDIEVVTEGAYSGPLPPRLQWSRYGDLLLVTWPRFAGL